MTKGIVRFAFTNPIQLQDHNKELRSEQGLSVLTERPQSSAAWLADGQLTKSGSKVAVSVLKTKRLLTGLSSVFAGRRPWTTGVAVEKLDDRKMLRKTLR